jgi:hypothetical protein
MPGVDFALGVEGPALLAVVVFRPAGVDGEEAASCIVVVSLLTDLFYDPL